MPASPPGRARRAACLAAAAVLVLSGCLGGTGGERAEPTSGPSGAGGGTEEPSSVFWTDPDGVAARQAARWKKEGRTGDARSLEKISRRPVARWIGPDDPGRQTRELTRAAAGAGRKAVLVAYNIPHRDCGMYSAGGAADAAAYRAWIEDLAAGIGDRETVVVLEPDAVPHMADGCLPERLHDERYELLAHAVRVLGEQPGAAVYLDAGNPSWIDDPEELAGPLRRAGAERADGFALNTSNFQTTGANTAYGRRLSAALGGAHFVIDTSRNGNGPLTGEDGEEVWCNPPGRALGRPPTERTGDELVDAHLWVKQPGESDGECRGAPPAGRWWPEYALELAENTP